MYKQQRHEVRNVFYEKIQRRLWWLSGERQVAVFGYLQLKRHKLNSGLGWFTRLWLEGLLKLARV